MNEMNRVEQIVSELAPELKSLAHFLHDNPELGLDEYKALAAQKKLLEKYGFRVETGLCGFDTSYCGVYRGKKTGPKIAMLAEYDALPELGHGCGHNLIAMVSVGAAIGMREFADKYGGEIYVFGTPAEETMGAKVEMSKQGIFDNIDVAMMAHPMDSNSDCMDTMAFVAHKISFYGKAAHAAASPEDGINALDAVINFFNLVNSLRQQTTEDARLHGIITKGGSAANVIPDHTEVIYCVRANRMKETMELSAKVLACAEAAALGTGCLVEHEKADEDFKDTCTNRYLAELCAKQIDMLGVKVERTCGARAKGSSDMGDVSYACPAVQSTFDICKGRHVSAHTYEFAKLAGSEEAIDAGLTYVKGFIMSAIEIMTEPKNLEKIKKEFNETIKEPMKKYCEKGL